MRKILAILAIIMITFSLAGCGKEKTNTETSGLVTSAPEFETSELAEAKTPSKEETESEKTVEAARTTTPTEEAQVFEVDEGLLNVKITIPSFFFEDMSDFDPDAYAEENGFKEAVVNEDGSVAVTMSKRVHNEIMAEMETETDRILKEKIESEDTPYIKEITASKGYRTVTVRVDKEGYENSWDMTPLSIYFNVVFYQIFDDAEPYCEVIIEDVETGEVLSSVIYPDALEE
ncbi:MAG: hypothetical protein SVP52_08030 [Chloroflexota bacterium]|nr:hypothetical protein [Chloroflexota bacterium]